MAHHKEIFITKFDYTRLRSLVGSGQGKGGDAISRLSNELARAEKVDPEAIASDVVTMNSTFRLKDLDASDDTRVLTLVFPDDADFEKGKISVLSPVGVAVLGYRAGDVIRWDVPAGKKSFRIEGIVYQPEAAGDYYL
ncbi:MAG: nucleoside diphosphate kinase regulator [Spirochaetes bacterium]|nr:nucleoside diphosphate kinase regulator [Spirochaetota bacterium]